MRRMGIPIHSTLRWHQTNTEIPNAWRPSLSDLHLRRGCPLFSEITDERATIWLFTSRDPRNVFQRPRASIRDCAILRIRCARQRPSRGRIRATFRRRKDRLSFYASNRTDSHEPGDPRRALSFPPSTTTYRRRRWFDACSCQPRAQRFSHTRCPYVVWRYARDLRLSGVGEDGIPMKEFRRVLVVSADQSYLTLA